MQATAKSFTFVGNEGQIDIPFFQRSYVWKRDNWEELLSDLSDIKRRHFLGSLILKQQTTQSGDPKKVLVIDGQQRLTTLSVLIKALFDSFDIHLRANTEAFVRQYLFYKRSRTDPNFHVKLRHSRSDANAYSKVIRYRLDDPNDILATDGHRIIECYRYFLNEFSSRDAEANSRLFDELLRDENKSLVVIDLDIHDDEQTIFDTINSAGVRLSPADIVKNALFQKVIDLVGEEETVQIYGLTWEKTFLQDDDSITFWETQRVTGRLLRDNLEILLHSVAVVNSFYDPEKHTLADLSTLYKQKIENIADLPELKSFINEICTYAEIFRRKIKIFDKATLFSFEDGEQRLFHVLNTQEISTFHPYILYLYRTFHQDTPALQQHLQALEKFVMQSIISGTDTKSFSKISKSFIDSPTEVQRRLQALNVVALQNGFRNISNKLATLILFWIELKRRHDQSRYDLKHLKYDYTLEHVMPQKWEQYWRNMPQKLNADQTLMDNDQAKEDRYNKIYWIGNMTLLTSTLNTSLRNFEYTRKMNGENRKKGIKHYADLSITKTDLVEPFEQGDSIWDESKIEVRTANLVREAMAIWG